MNIKSHILHLFQHEVVMANLLWWFSSLFLSGTRESLNDVLASALKSLYLFVKRLNIGVVPDVIVNVT
jgi:hypothetical protein